MAQIQQFSPVNYAGMQSIQDPTSSFMRGLQIAQAFQQRKQDEAANKLQAAKLAADTAKAQQEAARLATYQKDVAAAFENPTQEAFAALLTKHPDQISALSQSWKMLSGAQQDSEFLAGAQAFNSLQSGNQDVAKTILETQIEAMRNSGKDTSKLEVMRSTIDRDPKRAQAQIGFVLSAVDPDRWAKMGKESRESEQAPEALKKLTAEAAVKDIEAQFAPEKLAEDLNKQRAELVKLAVDTQRSEAERDKVRAEISAIDAKRRALADGKIPPEDRPALEVKLNDKFLKDTANFTGVKEAYRRVAAASPTPAGDLSLVFGYMKVLDPGSTVREGEQAQARNAAGVPDRIQSAYNRVLSGENLTPAQRENFRSEAKRLHDAAQIEEKKIRAGMERIVKNYGLNPENVFYYGGAQTPEPQAKAASTKSPFVMSAQTGLPVARDATGSAQTVKQGDY